jgi:hypothetical protein
MGLANLSPKMILDFSHADFLLNDKTPEQLQKMVEDGVIIEDQKRSIGLGPRLLVQPIRESWEAKEESVDKGGRPINKKAKYRSHGLSLTKSHKGVMLMCKYNVEHLTCMC